MSPLRRLTAAGAALAFCLSWAVTAAGAQERPPPRKVVFSSPVSSDPGDAALVTENGPTVRFFLPMGVGDQLQERTVELTVRPLNGSGPPITLRKEIPPQSGATCQAVTFENVELPTNGPYEAVVITSDALDQDPILTGECRGATDRPGTFFMGVRPTAPTAVKADVTQPLQAATISWNRAPERDVLRYRVLRAKGPDGKFDPIGETAATRTSFTDPSSATGGEFTYRIVAIRRGSGKPGQPEFLESEPSAPSQKVTVAPPAPPPAPTAGTARRSTRPSPPSRPRYITPGETGFSETLPFAGGPELAEESGEVAGDSGQVEELGANEARSDSPRSLALLAAGLLATVLAMHLLWVKAEVDREPLEVLRPE